MSTVIDIERLYLLLNGREGDEIPGCCGARETHPVEPTPEECIYLQDNISEILCTYGCDGSLKGGDFSGKECKCSQMANYRRKEGSDPNLCCRHAEYKVEKLYAWGYLMKHDLHSIHKNTWGSIMTGFEKLGPNSIDHCARYHLFRSLNGLIFTSTEFRLVWDLLKNNLPNEFAEFKCCDKGCSLLRYYGQEIKKENIPILEMCYSNDIEQFEYYCEDYLQHRRRLGITQPVQVKKVITEDCNDDLQEFKDVSTKNNITILESDMLQLSIQNHSLKCMRLFAEDNPKLVQMYSYFFLSPSITDVSYGYSPILHYVLSTNAYACSYEKQQETAKILQLLIDLGADINAPTIIKDAKIPLGNILELYEYNYPKSPVMEFFESLDITIPYDSSEKVIDAIELLNPKERKSQHEDTAYTFLRQYSYTKDPTKFEAIARKTLDKYREDWNEAGGRFPYAWLTGVGFVGIEFINDVVEGMDDELSPDQIEKVWGK